MGKAVFEFMGRANRPGTKIAFTERDVWSTPPWAIHQHHDDTDEVAVRFTYSNASLLERLQVHVVDESDGLDPMPPAVGRGGPAPVPARGEPRAGLRRPPQRLLFDPTTHRLQGTTSTFFATMGIMPAGNVDIPHRHTSAAINYNFQGRGRALTEQEQIARLSTLAVAGHERR